MRSLSALRMMIFALTTLPLAGSAATVPSDRKSLEKKASDWVANERQAAEGEMAEQEKLVAADKGAIAKAESALKLAREYKDAKAEPVAQLALETAQKALARDERNRADRKERVGNMGAMLARISGGVPALMALPLNMSGDVWVGTGADKVRLDPTRVLQPGDRITTGIDSKVTLSLLNGEQLTLGPGSVFSLSKERKGTLDRFLYRLIKGRERVRSRGAGHFVPTIASADDEHEYRAAAAVAAVRGTDFQMTVSADGLGHFSLYDGRIELGADAEEKPREKPRPWWLTEGVAAYAAPMTGAVARIAALRGTASIVNKEKSSRPAKTGDPMAAGERLETGPGALAHLDLRGGQRLALGADARLTGVLDSKGAPMYGVGRGVAHVWGAAGKEPSQFLTPNTAAQSHAKEFEVSVGAGGAAEYTPIEGSLDISAIGDKLDWSKIDAWWDR